MDGQHAEVARILREHPRVNPNKRNRYGRTAAYSALSFGDEATIDLFLADLSTDWTMPTDPAAAGYDLNFDLFLVPSEESKGKVVAVLNERKIDLGPGFEWLRPLPDTPEREFILACLHGDYDEVDRLLEEDVDVNTRGQWGVTGMMAACSGAGMPDEEKRKDYLKVVKLLSGEETTVINAPDDAGRTAYYFAACFGMVEILDWVKGVKHRDPILRKDIHSWDLNIPHTVIWSLERR